MATLWWEGTPQLETFFNILELTIKRALQEVHPHDRLVLDYIYTSNDTLKDASEITVEIENIEADGETLEVEGDIIILSGNDDRGFSRNSLHLDVKLLKMYTGNFDKIISPFNFIN